MAAGLERLAVIAAAFSAVGLLDPGAGDEVLREVEDALLARGADWIDPGVPDLLDIDDLRSIAQGSATDEPQAVVVYDGPVTCAELWRERIVLWRPDGSSEVPVAPDLEREFLVSLGPQGSAAVDVGGDLGAPVREVEPARVTLDADGYLARLAALVQPDALVDAVAVAAAAFRAVEARR